ncbi:retrovirus-related pol polyprotein from transposon TNT 1-94 [Tanacetum coccineum]
MRALLTRITSTNEVLSETIVLDLNHPKPVVKLGYTHGNSEKNKYTESVSKNEDWECSDLRVYYVEGTWIIYFCGTILVIPESEMAFRQQHASFAIRSKSSKKPHKPKSEDTNQEKLYLLHMDLCGPMRVASVNGKKYILVIVDDYSRFTWVKCLRSKDEAPAFIINFLKMIQVVI